jgi:ABC-type transport system substrate-binding protein
VQAAGFHVLSKLNDQVVTIYMQQQWDPAPVSDKRVRQALNLAIDKEAIMQHVFAGQGVPVAMYPIGSYGVAGGADPELQPHPYDPVKARQLLAEAGYPNGFETKIYSSEDVVFMCQEMGIDTGIDLDRLIDCARLAEGLVGHTLPGKVMKGGNLRKYREAAVLARNA